jgi:hypothetical protein
MRADGVTRFKAMCLAPQNSRTSTGLYRRAVLLRQRGWKWSSLRAGPSSPDCWRRRSQRSYGRCGRRLALEAGEARSGSVHGAFGSVPNDHDGRSFRRRRTARNSGRRHAGPLSSGGKAHRADGGRADGALLDLARRTGTSPFRVRASAAVRGSDRRSRTR